MAHNLIMTEAFIYDAIRTPRGEGRKSGSLYQVKPISLLADCFKAIQSRNKLDTSLVSDAIIGCVTPVDEQGANIAKAALLFANWPHTVSGFQLNRFCASGLEAVNLAAMKVRSGWEDLVVAGGIESMSRVKMESDRGALLFDPETITKVGYVPQGISADLIATLEGFSRKDLDAYALLSQKRTAEAWEKAYFKKSIVPVLDKAGLSILEKDEHPRPGTTMADLEKLSPAFRQMGENGFDNIAMRAYPEIECIQHLHTAGNSSGIVDGAALVLIGSKEVGEKLGMKARARIVASGIASSGPTIMLTGPTPATKKALANAGMKASDIDLWEMNEAFAAPVLKFQKDLDIDMNKLNVNGGAISMGHPLGATGAILVGTLLDEMERRDVQTGLVTMCVGGGMGVSTVLERV